MNRRIAAVRGLFEYMVMSGARDDNPVPAARRSSGLRASGRGLLGHLGPGWVAAGAWSVSLVACPSLWNRSRAWTPTLGAPQVQVPPAGHDGPVHLIAGLGREPALRTHQLASGRHDDDDDHGRHELHSGHVDPIESQETLECGGGAHG